MGVSRSEDELISDVRFNLKPLHELV